jgi:rod shape-determining protein MreB
MIVEWLRTYLEQMPETMAASVAEGAMVLTGGGALLRNLDWLLEKEIGLKVITAENAAACTALGTAKAAENMNWFRKRRKSRGTL